MSGSNLGLKFLQTGRENQRNLVRHRGNHVVFPLFSALTIAAAHGNDACVVLLVRTGADVNAATERDGITALMHAAQACLPDTVDFLLQVGADITTRDKCGNTALHHAVEKNNVSCLDALLRWNGADVNSVNEKGNSTLHVAAGCDSLRCCQQLLKSGADVNVLNHAGESALQYHARESRNEDVRLLLFGAGCATGERGLDFLGICSEDVVPLKQMCRTLIRRHLTLRRRRPSLVASVPELGLPSPIVSFLLFYASL